MKVRIWAVTTCIPAPGEKPRQPALFGTEEQAVAYAEFTLRGEWATVGMSDDDGKALPYPGDWETANRQIAARFSDGSWGEYALTWQDVEVGDTDYSGVSEDGDLYDGWSAADSRAAIAEGWAIFDANGALEIHKDDESGIFEDDDAAQDHVIAQSEEGSELHLRALAVCAAHNAADSVKVMWEVAGEMDRTDLINNAEFQAFCANTATDLTPAQAAEEWGRR